MGKPVADIIVETLQNAGVKHCYGIVGDTLNLIARSLDKSEIEWVSVRHEEAPIKIAVYDNGKLGFVEIEQKAEGMLDTFTKLKNPNFAGVARALGLWGQTVSDADQFEAAVRDWLAQPGPALLHVHVNPMQLVMPPFMRVEPAIGMALYSTRAILHGRGGDVWEMAKENFL
jgi:pyruvate dehydrogenase (quinone)